jgi:hypothetical protein
MQDNFGISLLQKHASLTLVLILPDWLQAKHIRVKIHRFSEIFDINHDAIDFSEHRTSPFKFAKLLL